MTQGLVVDLFAGGGGASVGIEAALGRPIDVAINHDAIALAVHKANHPNTQHLEADLYEVKPRQATGGRPVDVLWASPDCTHHSTAKGGKPLKQDIRSLAWVVVRWAAAVRPRVIFVENVPEFLGWGPLDKNDRPIKRRKGATFLRWRRQLMALGYNVEHRVLDASLFGAPTRRRRVFIVARLDGRPVRWPEPTHGPVCSCAEVGDERDGAGSHRGNGEARSRRPGASPGRQAEGGSQYGLGLRERGKEPLEADWGTERARVSPDVRHHEREGRHVDGSSDRLDSVQRLAESGSADQPQRRREDQQPTGESGARDARGKQQARSGGGLVGAESWTDERSGEAVGGTGGGYSGRQARRPEQRGDRGGVRRDGIVCPACGLAKSPSLKPLVTAASCIDWSLPCPSIFERARPLAEKTQWRVAQGIRKFVLENARPFIVRMAHGEVSPDGAVRRRGHGAADVDAPLPTVMPQGGGGGFGIAVPHLTKFQENSVGQDPREPMDTVMAGAQRFGVVAPALMKFRHDSAGAPVDQPMPVITAGGQPRPGRPATGNPLGVLAPHLMKVNHGKAEPRGESVEHPLSTVCAAQRGHALVAPVLATIDQRGSGDGTATPVESPLPTTVTKNRHAVAAATLVQLGYGERDGQAARVPGVEKPLGTIVAGGRKHAIVGAWLAKHFGGVVGQELQQPASTVTAKDHHGFAAVMLEPGQRHGRGQRDAREPLSTVVTKDRHAVAATTLVKLRGECSGAPMDEPAPALTAGGTHVAEVRAFLTAYYGSDGNRGKGQSLRDPLRTISAKHKLGLVTIEGTEYQIVDIGLRMLQPHELLRAQFGEFADGYDLSAARGKSGKRSKSAEVRLIGNSVCPHPARALVAENVPEGVGRAA